MATGLNGHSREVMYSTKMIAEAMDKDPNLIGERRRYVKWIRENLNGRGNQH